MAGTSLVYWNDKLAKTQGRHLQFVWNIASGTPTLEVAGAPILVTQGALVQATIDTFLGTTAEFDYLAFDATSMGTDALGVIVDMKGQAAVGVWAELRQLTSTGGVTQAGARSTAKPLLTTSLTTEFACGASTSITGSGNLAFKGVISGLDAADGILVLDMYYISK